MNKDKFDIDGFEIDMESKDKPQSKKRNSGNPEKKSGSKNANSADSSDVLPPLDDDITEESPESQAAEEGLPDDDLNAHNLEGIDNEEDEEKPEGEEDSNDDEKSEDEEDSEGEEDSNDESEDNSDSESNEEHDNNDLNDYDLEDAQEKNKQAGAKEDDKPKDDKPKDRKDLNPNRAEAAKDSKPSKEGPKGGAGKLAENAKNALANKVNDNKAVESAKNVTKLAKKMAAIVSNIGTTIFQLVTNPVTYIGIGLVIVFVAIASFTSSVGQNDFNILCDDSGVGSVSIDPNADSFTRQAAIASWLTSTPFEVYGGEPLTTEQAAGIIGNMIEESYGANPKAIQGDDTMTEWESCDNDCVLGWGTVGGKAIGIVQWDTTRRVALVIFAKSEGTQWHDLNTQLKYLRNEMETNEAGALEKGGFNEKGKTIAEYAKIWNKSFERSKKSGTPEGDNPRIASAEAFASEFSGGVSFAGLSDGCLGMAGGFSGVGIDTSSLVDLAISAAHVNRSSALESCGDNLVNCGQNTATDVYKQAKLSAEASTGKDGIHGLLASCDRFVATMYRATGKDPTFPWGATQHQLAYMESNPNWQRINCQDRQPGDVVFRKGHIMLYVGVVNGKDSIASASLGHRSGNLSGVSCSGNQFIADGGPAEGWRKVN